MSSIEVDGEVPEQEEEEEAAEEGVDERAGADEAVIGVPGLEIATTENLEKIVVILKADLGNLLLHFYIFTFFLEPSI